MKIFLTIIYFIFCLNLYSQNALTGYLKSQNGEAVVFANVVMLNAKDSTFISGCISNNEGFYTLTDIPSEDFILNYSCLGYDNYTLFISIQDFSPDLGTVTLQENSTLLDEVTISAKRLHVYSKGGSLITDISNSSLKNIGSAKEVLKHIPGVIATKDSYQVFGKGSPVIYIDNKKVRDNNELQLLNSNNILQVELITNPGAAYDAETRSVLRITTNRKKENGLSITLDSESAQSRHFSHNEGISLNGNFKGLNIFGSYYYERVQEDIKYDVIQTTFHENEYTEISSSKYNYRDNNNSYSFGLSYDLNKNYSIGAQLSGYHDRSSTRSFPETDWIRMYMNGNIYADNRNSLFEKESAKFYNTNVYFFAKPNNKFSFQVDADFVYKKPVNNQLITEESLLENSTDFTHIYSTNKNEVYAVKSTFDYKITDRNMIKWGVDFSDVTIDGWMENPEGRVVDNQYNNQENKYAGFILYRLKGEKITGEVGLRYEYVQSEVKEFGESISKKNYSDLLPSFSLSIPINKVGISFNFTNRILRPSFRQLNNSVIYNNIFYQEKGNPYLTSQKIFDFDTGISYSLFNLRLNYQYIKDYIYTTAEPNPNVEGASMWYAVNAPKYQKLGAILVGSPEFGSWKPTFTAGIYKPMFKLNYLDQPYKYNKPYGLFVWDNEIELPKDFLFRADIRWYTKGDKGINRMNGYGSLDLSIEKGFFSDKLNVILSGDDIFNWSKTKDIKRINYIFSERRVNTYARTVILSLRWSINTAKTKYKGKNAASGEINRF